MPVDLALMKWIRENRTLSRSEVLARLKSAGHSEQNILDSYDAVVQQTMGTPAVPTQHKEPWLAVVLSLLWPGVGHIYAGAVGSGIAILLLGGLGWILTLTIIGAILGIPLLIGLYIWAIIGSYGAAQAANRAT